jgi:hypothetical protein
MSVSAFMTRRRPEPHAGLWLPCRLRVGDGHERESPAGSSLALPLAGGEPGRRSAAVADAFRTHQGADGHSGAIRADREPTVCSEFVPL